MKALKKFVVLLIVVLSASSAFGNLNDDLLKAVSTAKPDSNRIKYLVEQGADVNTKMSNGTTVLMLTARFNLNPDITKLLIEHGADVNAETISGSTALLEAARDNPNPDVFRVLVNAGANVNYKNSDGRTVLMQAIYSLPARVIDVYGYLSYGQKFDRYAKVYDKFIEVLDVLIKAGVDINAQDKDGWTALMWAGTRWARQCHRIFSERRSKCQHCR